MKINSFKCTKLHGYISKQITFNDGLTILTGINGSGKTSVIQAIIALICFDLKSLMRWEYEELCVEFIHNSSYKIEAHPDKESIRFTINGKSIAIPKYTTSVEYIQEMDTHIERLEIEFKSSTIVKEIAEIPPPLMLGIDRKFDSANDRNMRTAIGRRNSNFRKSNSNDAFQEVIQNAISLAESRYRGIKFTISKASESLKTKIVSSSIKFMPQISIRSNIVFKRDWDVMRSKIDLAIETFKQIGVSDSDAASLNDVYDRYHSNALKLVGKEDFQSIHKDEDAFEAYMQLQFLMPAVEHIESLVSMIEESRQIQDKIEKPIHLFKKTINSFLIESGKIVDFSPTGELLIHAHRKEGGKIKTSGLSSGEAQLLSIFCILGFQDRRQLADSVLIDEPELSLHILWQEKFIPAMLDISPSSQLIVATHSPSIIGERTASCIDVGDCDA